MSLSPRQEAFCVEYATNGGDGTAAYISAYRPRNKRTAAACASRLLRDANIIKRIRELLDEAAKPKITTMTQVKAMWSSVIQDPAEKTSDRLKASELFAKSAGAFLHFRPDPDSPSGFVYGEAGGEDVFIVLPPLEKSEEDEELEKETIEELKSEGWSIIK